ncbi:unnamed protein product, partial [Porites lobata]
STAEIDECIRDYHRCDPNAACQNTVGSYICTCKAGFYGNGKKCFDIDECRNKTQTCDVNAVCSNTHGSYKCTCKSGYSGDGKKCIVLMSCLPAKNCAELYKAGKRSSGVYKIDPDGVGVFDVYCDQTTAGGGWTVFQKRLDGSVNFYRSWNDYKKGFGNLNGEFWLGLDKIHHLTKTKSKLRVELEDFNRNTAYAEYSYFAIADERSKYKLSLGTYSGNAGDSLSYHKSSSFSTKDRDNDSSDSNCATSYKGAWWYGNCHYSNLNGLYHRGRHSSGADGVNWYHWKGNYYSAKRAEMKLKPVNF